MTNNNVYASLTRCRAEREALFDRRQMMALLGLAPVLPLFGCGTESDGRPVLRVSSQKGSTRSLVLASKVLNGAPYRVEWMEFPTAQGVVEAMHADSVDVGLLGDVPFIFAYQAGNPIRAVTAMRSASPDSTTALVVPAESAVRGVHDLKGQRIATTRGSTGHYLLLRLLDKAGLQPADVRMVFLSPGDAKAAFSSGAIDAWVIWSAYYGAAVLYDKARIIATGTGIMTGYSFMAATDAAIASKRDMLRDFLMRHDKAQHWSDDNKEAFVRLYTDETGLPEDVSRFAALRNIRLAVPINAAVRDEEEAVLRNFAASGLIKPTRPLAEAYLPLDDLIAPKA